MFPDGGVKAVQIEDPVYFTEVVQSVIDEKKTGEGDFILSEGDDILNFSKSADIILSPFVLDLENRKFISKIIRQMIDVANEEEFLETRTISGQVLNYIYKLSEYLDFDIVLDEDLDMQQMIKSSGIQIAVDESDLLTRVTDYILLLRNLMNVKLIIGVNFHLYFSEKQLELLFKTMEMKKISLLLLESCSICEMIDKENRLIIDRDLCEI